MENPCKIVCFGDSITKEFTPLFESRLRAKYNDYQIDVVNAGVVSETSRGALVRLAEIRAMKPTVCLVGFGMNDWRKGVERDEFRGNLRQIVQALQEDGVRVLLLTISPDWQNGQSSSQIDSYNTDVLAVADELRVRVVDVNALWKQEVNPLSSGLRDEIHPNEYGYSITVEALMRVVPMVSTTLVWQYNGYHAACNYSCPYCYYPTKRHYFRYTVEEWREGFLKTFGKQRVTFYLSYGEPSLGKQFYEVLDMIASEPQWDAIMTTNLSQPLERIVSSRLAKEGRFNINASFHPTQKVTVQGFLNQLLKLRAHGIEVPIVYVAYPEQTANFESYFRVFDQHNFFVHIRRFRGRYKNKFYPEAYTEAERRLVARYMDEISLKMMLSNYKSVGRLSYSGCFYIVVNNDGDVGASPEFPEYGKRGNILSNDVRLDRSPQPYPGDISEGAVDGVSTFLDLGLKELKGNHIWSYATQGGVKVADGKIYYPFRNTDFSDPRVRKQLNFGEPVSNLFYQMRHPIKAAELLISK